MAEEIKKEKEVEVQETDTQPTAEVEAIKITANDRLKKHYPDQDPQNEQEWENLRNRFHDDMEEREKNFSSLEQEVNDLIASDEDLALILNEMLVNKLPFRAALAKVLDPTDLTPIEGEEDYEAYNKAYNERVSQSNARIARQKEIDDNAVKSAENIDKFCEDKGYDESAKDEIYAFINEMFDAIVEKNITPELLEKIDQARNYDVDVAQAGVEGEIRGRNANIEAQRADAVHTEEGDGIPTPSQAGGAPLQPKGEENNMRDFWAGIGEKKWK